MNNNVIGLDIAKNIFHMYTFNEEKSKPVKKKLKRAELLTFFANHPVSLIRGEAFGAPHERFWDSMSQKPIRHAANY